MFRWLRTLRKRREQLTLWQLLEAYPEGVWRLYYPNGSYRGTATSSFLISTLGHKRLKDRVVFRSGVVTTKTDISEVHKIMEYAGAWGASAVYLATVDSREDFFAKN